MYKEVKKPLDYLFWYTVSHFVIDEKYRIIHLNEDELEVWLENTTNRDLPIIRLSQRDVTWRVLVERDFNQVVHVMSQFRKELNRPKLTLANIFLCEKTIETSGMFNEQKQSENKAVTVNSYVLTPVDQAADMALLADDFKWDIDTMLPIAEQTSEAVEDLKTNMISHMSANVKLPTKKNWKDQFLWTYLLIAINVLVFIAMTVMGGSTNTYVLSLFGAKVNELLVAGEWWRFITPMFLHIGFTHLLMNMVSLFIIGTLVERIFGGWRFMTIYFIAGIAGVIASFVYSDSLSAGASGAIFGLFGALLYLIIKKPQIYWKTLGVNVLFLLGINLAYGFVVSNVDQYAHIGGLLGGLLVAYCVAIKGQYVDWKRWGYVVLTAVIFSYFIVVGFGNVNVNSEVATGNSVAMSYIEHKKMNEAKKVIGVIEKNNYNDYVSDFLLGTIEFNEGNHAAAITALERAIAKEPNFPEAYYNLALVHQAAGNHLKAVAAAKKASAQSSDVTYQALYEKLNESN